MLRSFPRLVLSALLLVGVALELGCVVAGPPAPVAVVPAPEAHGGPPAHAPAWGYRQKHRERAEHEGLTLRFEPSLGVNVVVGYPGIYFADGLFLRFASGTWQASPRLAGPWRIHGERSVPPGLRARYHRIPPGQEKKWERHHGEESGAAHPDW